MPTPGSTAISIAIFKNGTNHSQGNNLQMVALTSPIGVPLEPPVLLDGNNAPNVSDVVYLVPGDVIEIRVFVGQAIPFPSGVPSLLAETQATYVSVHKLS